MNADAITQADRDQLDDHAVVTRDDSQIGTAPHAHHVEEVLAS